eukprot:460284-Alexandrium_andersonii.AAC.1
MSGSSSAPGLSEGPNTAWKTSSTEPSDAEPTGSFTSEAAPCPSRSAAQPAEGAAHEGWGWPSGIDSSNR